MKKHPHYLAVYTTEEVGECLKLASVVLKMSKSRIVRSAIDKWMKANSLTKQELFKMFIQQIETDWEIYNYQQKIDKQKPQLTKQQFIENRKLAYGIKRINHEKD